MDFYLNLLNDKERGPDDQPSIGIILCAEKDDIEVEYALRSKAKPIATHRSGRLRIAIETAQRTERQIAHRQAACGYCAGGDGGRATNCVMTRIALKRRAHTSVSTRSEFASAFPAKGGAVRFQTRRPRACGWNSKW